MSHHSDRPDGRLNGMMSDDRRGFFSTAFSIGQSMRCSAVLPVTKNKVLDPVRHRTANDEPITCIVSPVSFPAQRLSGQKRGVVVE